MWLKHMVFVCFSAGFLISQSVTVKQDAMPLAYTLCKMVMDLVSKNMITIESEHRTMSAGVKAQQIATHVCCTCLDFLG
jgi:hypothetical protein